jgi:hypothetical protein
MRARRILWFSIAILLGLSAGLIYGWLLSPRGAAASAPESLRADYKTDVVLMVAESYAQDGDPAAAAGRLAWLDGTPPVRQVQQAILNGQELGYARADIETLARLFQGLQVWTPVPDSEPAPTLDTPAPATPPDASQEPKP